MLLITYICGIVLVELKLLQVLCNKSIKKIVVLILAGKKKKKKKKKKRTYSGCQKALLKVHILWFKWCPTVVFLPTAKRFIHIAAFLPAAKSQLTRILTSYGGGLLPTAKNRKTPLKGAFIVAFCYRHNRVITIAQP